MTHPPDAAPLTDQEALNKHARDWLRHVQIIATKTFLNEEQANGILAILAQNDVLCVDAAEYEYLTDGKDATITGLRTLGLEQAQDAYNWQLRAERAEAELAVLKSAQAQRLTDRELMADALNDCQYSFVDHHAGGARVCSLASCVCEDRAHDFIDRLTGPSQEKETKE